MIADRIRMDAYAAALRQAVNPGKVVLDIGTGTGICALLSCRFGARRVYAVEPDSVIQTAREIIAANGYSDRVEFIQDHSTRISLPERADVIVSDLRGVLPQFSHHLPSLADARQRHLASGGVLIPQRDILYAAVVQAAEAYARHVNPWWDQDFRFDLSPARRLLVNSWTKARFRADQLLTKPLPWVELDYVTREHSGASGEMSWLISRAGTGHGFVCWFDATLLPGVGFSNAPGEPELIYGQAFFPWRDSIELAPGDIVNVGLYADLVGKDYVWRWNTRVEDCEGHVKADFKQSTFFAAPLAVAQLQKRAAGFVPRPTEDAEIDLFILGLLAESITVGEIARRLKAGFPTRFPGWVEALTRVGDLSEKYSR
jgi:protein arginine N-methyltransferase 1